MYSNKDNKEETVKKKSQYYKQKLLLFLTLLLFITWIIFVFFNHPNLRINPVFKAKNDIFRMNKDLNDGLLIASEDKITVLDKNQNTILERSLVSEQYLRKTNTSSVIIRDIIPVDYDNFAFTTYKGYAVMMDYNGDVIWHSAKQATPTSLYISAYNNSLFVASDSIIQISGDGQELLNIALPGEATSEVSFDSDERIYVSIDILGKPIGNTYNQTHFLMCYDRDGSKLWSFKLDTFGINPVIDLGEGIAVDSIRTIYAIDDSGKQLWSFQSNYQHTQPILLNNERIVIISDLFNKYYMLSQLFPRLGGHSREKYTCLSKQGALLFEKEFSVRWSGNYYVYADAVGSERIFPTQISDKWFLCISDGNELILMATDGRIISRKIMDFPRNIVPINDHSAYFTSGKTIYIASW